MVTLTAGQTLSSYEILGPLGAGAMGEVWRARDSRLGREVAIKVLPAPFAADAERLRRFEREARTLASLNHPNVAQIFGVDQVDDTCFLVLELVEGESLDERLRRGPLPVDEAIDVCRQIAEGLEAAHEAGVIHRDLKPANVALTPDGRVKLLDFGLAKPSRETGGAGSSTDSVLSTEAGRLLGTPTYMAPEQARGKPIDRRVDLWAFGCVMYECLTGARAFAGETLTDVLAAVLDKSPDWSRLPAGTPPGVRTLIARCLCKDPRQRLRDAGDARLELESPALSAPGALPAHPARRRLAVALPWLAVALPWLAVLLVAGLWWRAQHSGLPGTAEPAQPVTDRPTQLAIRLPLGLELFGATDQNQILALSPDGRRVAFVARAQDRPRIFLRALDAPEVVELPGSAGAGCPFFSPDGQWLAYSWRGRLQKVPVSGGQPIEIADSAPARGGAWGPDGSIVYTPSITAGLLRIPPGGGAPVELTRPDAGRGERSHRWPAFLPGGDEVAFTVGMVDSPGDYEGADIDAVSLSTGTRRKLVNGASFVRTLDQDTLVFARGGHLFAVPFAGLQGGPLDASVPVLEGVAGAAGSGVVYFDVSSNGVLAYMQQDPHESEFEMAWVGRDGAVEPLPVPPREYHTPRISPDGSRVVVSIGPGGGGTSDLWVFPSTGGELSRLTFDQRSGSAVWSRDGERVAFVTAVGPHGSFFSTRADGTQEREKLAEFADVLPRFPIGFTPDGTELLYVTQGTAGTSQDLFRWSLGEQRSTAIAETAASEEYGALSPDGAWLAYVSDNSGAYEVYVSDYPHLRGRWQISDAATAPIWSHDQQELFVVRGSRILAIRVQTTPSFSAGESRVVAELDFLPTEEARANYDVGPDGRVLIVRATSKESYLGHIEIVQHWRVDRPAALTR